MIFSIITEEIINAGTFLFCAILLLITPVLNFYGKLELKSYSLASLTFIYTHKNINTLWSPGSERLIKDIEQRLKVSQKYWKTNKGNKFL